MYLVDFLYDDLNTMMLPNFSIGGSMILAFCPKFVKCKLS